MKVLSPLMLCTALTLTTACPGPDGAIDAARDAGSGDRATAVDAAGATDAGTRDDATTADRTPGVDAALPDAGPDPDARGAPDRGSPDAGAEDTAPTDTGGDDGAGGDDAVGGDDAAAPDAGGDPTELVGTIHVIESLDESHPGTRIEVALYDRVNHLTSPDRYFALTAAANQCELRTAGFVGDWAWCDPECGVDEVCTPALTCEPWPQVASAGTLVFEGLNMEFTMAPDYGAWQHFQFNTGALFDPGAAVTVTAPGAEVEPFTLEARGVTDLEVIPGLDLVVHEGEDVEVRWTPQGEGEIELFFTPMIHMTINRFIRCRVADSGAHSIPWELLQHFPYDDECGHGECAPRGYVSRFTEDVVALESGLVRLRVESQTDTYIWRPRP